MSEEHVAKTTSETKEPTSDLAETQENVEEMVAQPAESQDPVEATAEEKSDSENDQDTQVDSQATEAVQKPEPSAEEQVAAPEVTADAAASEEAAQDASAESQPATAVATQTEASEAQAPEAETATATESAPEEVAAATEPIPEVVAPIETDSVSDAAAQAGAEPSDSGETLSKPATATSAGAEAEASGSSSEKSFEELLDEYDQYRRYHAGDIVEGTVVSVSDSEVLLDIGARVEGAVPISEVKDEKGELVVQYGEKIKVMVCRYGKDAQYVPLSFERARVSHIWDKIESIANSDETIEGLVVEKVKGGFIVDIGVRAFLPTSLATVRPQKDYQDLIGLRAPFQITKLQRRRGNIILSRKELLKKEYDAMRSELLSTISEGAVLEGRVKNITDYGAFVDLGGLDGLLHITDMSWGRVNHPNELLEVNQELQVKVLRIDIEKEKVSLGLKQITPDPWLSAPENYPPRKIVEGKVLNLTGFGAFIELEPGVEGLVHVSELSWTKKIRNPSQALNKGDVVKVKVLDIDVENRKVSLSVRQTEENPWDYLAERFPVGSKVKGKVRNITEFGAFVEIEEGVDGLVHISDFLWGERSANPEDFVTKGEEVEVIVLAVDSENHKVSLGIKQLSADPWLDFINQHKEGSVVPGTVARVTDGGVSLKLAEHVEGFIRASETGVERGKRLSDTFAEGQEYQAMIIRISRRDRRLDLSVKRLLQHQERKAIEEFTQSQGSGGATFGDVMKHLVK